MADPFKAEFGVQTDTVSLISINGCDNSVISEGTGTPDEVLQEERANAASMPLVVDIYGILDSVPIS